MGPREIIANHTVISNSGLNYGATSGWSDTPFYAAFDETNGLDYYTSEYDTTGKIVRTVGTLDNPLGISNAGSYVTPTIITSAGYITDGGPDPTPFYVGCGPIYKLTDGTLLQWYQPYQKQALPPPAPGYQYGAMAMSTNGGENWTDLGEMMRPPVTYSPSRSYEVAMAEAGNIQLDPTGSYFYYYNFETTSPVSDVRNRTMVARALVSDVANAVSNGLRLNTLWYNYTGGGSTAPWTATADGGPSTYLVPGNSKYIGWNTIQWNQYLKRYTLIGNKTSGDSYPILYSDSTDGLTWTAQRTFMTPDGDGGTNYLSAFGIEEGFPNGNEPSSYANGEFYLDYVGDIDKGLNGSYGDYWARRKIWVLDNFDNDTTGAVPSETGWLSVSGFAEPEVETSPTMSTYHPNSLKIVDTASTVGEVQKVFEVNGSASTAAGMEFRSEVYPVSSMGTSTSIKFYMENGTGSDNQAFDVAIVPPGNTNDGTSYTDYTLQYYNGTSWALFPGAASPYLGTATNFENSWHLIDINGTSTKNATVSLDHVVYGTIPTPRYSQSGLDRVLITGGGTGTATFYLDNVFLYPSQPGDTFENDTVAEGTLPALPPNGWTVTATDGNSSVLVSASEAYTGGYSNPEGPGSQSMQITDGSTSVAAEVEKVVDPTPSKWLEAQIYPVSLGTNNSFFGIALQNKSNITPTGTVFNMGIFPPNTTYGAGSVNYYTLQAYENNTWTSLANLGTSGVLNTWHQIDVDAESTTSANVYFEYSGTMHSYTISEQGTSSVIDRVLFDTGEAAGTGLNAYVDNVYLAPAMLNDNDFAFDKTGTLPYGYSLAAGTEPTLEDTVPGYDGPNALHVQDGATAPSVVKIVAPSLPAQESGITVPGKSIDLWFYPNTIASGDQIYFDLASGSTKAFRLSIDHSGNVYDWPGGNWNMTPLTNADNNNAQIEVNPTAWNELEIIASNEYNAPTAYLNGNLLSSLSWWTAPTAPIDRAIFSCSSSGADFYIDDVIFN